MSESRSLNERYAEIGAELIATEDALKDVRESEATVCYLSSDHAKTSNGRVVFGECEKVQDKNKWAIPADYLIVIYEPNAGELDDEHLKRLMLHELLHIGIDHDKDGNEVHRIRPHDLEDFRECVNRWGVDWISD